MGSRWVKFGEIPPRRLVRAGEPFARDGMVEIFNGTTHGQQALLGSGRGDFRAEQLRS